MESKEVVKQEMNEISVAQAMQDSGITSQDLVIPRLLLMQNTSEFVGDGNAKLCDVVHSQTLEVIGGLTQPVDIVPLKMHKTWRIYDVSGKQPKFLRQEAVTPSNVNWAWDDVEEGVPVRRDICMNFFVLLLSELKKEEGFPCMISFKRTSMYAGKQLATHLFKMSFLGKPAYAQSVSLQVSKQKTEINTYGVFEIGKGTPLDAKYQTIAANWNGILNSMAYKVEEDQDAPQVTPPAPIVVGAPGEMKF